MARLMIDCPVTGKPVFTGIDMPAQALENATMIDNKVTCPHCRDTHVWQKEEAYLEKETVH